jgi:hypothetical protein
LIQVFGPWILAGFLFAFSMPRTTVAQSPLNEYLARLESSGANMLIKSETDRDGSISSLCRFSGNYGIESKIIKDMERRWIWNSSYVALVEKAEEGKWSLHSLLYPNSEVYEKARSSSTTAAQVFGGALWGRIKSLDQNYKELDSEGFVYEYQVLPEHPMYSADPVWNSMAFRFERNSEELRLREINFYESSGDPGSETVIEWVLSLEYPSDALFPMELNAKGSVVLGSIPGMRDEDLWKKRRIETDKVAKFDRSECYLAFYGLPEPKLARKDNAWAWFLLAALLSIGAGVALWKWRRK